MDDHWRLRRGAEGGEAARTAGLHGGHLGWEQICRFLHTPRTVTPAAEVPPNPARPHHLRRCPETRGWPWHKPRMSWPVSTGVAANSSAPGVPQFGLVPMRTDRTGALRLSRAVCGPGQNRYMRSPTIRKRRKQSRQAQTARNLQEP